MKNRHEAQKLLKKVNKTIIRYKEKSGSIKDS